MDSCSVIPVTKAANNNKPKHLDMSRLVIGEFGVKQ